MTMTLLLGTSVLLALGVALASLPAVLRHADRRFLLITALGCVCLLPLFQYATSLLGTGWQWQSALGSDAQVESLNWLPKLYLLGAMVMALRIARELHRTRQLKRNSTPNTELSNTFINPDIASACAVGIFRPSVYLPASSKQWSAKTLTLVLEHERTHIRHHDTRWMLLAELMRAALWFNPLAHLFVSRFNQALEDACDEAVLRAGADRRSYATCLLDIAEHQSRTPMLAAAMSSRGLQSMSQRITHIMSSKSYQTSSLWRTTFIGSIVATTLIAACHQPIASGTPEADLAQEATLRLEADPFPAH